MSLEKAWCQSNGRERVVGQRTRGFDARLCDTFSRHLLGALLPVG